GRLAQRAAHDRDPRAGLRLHPVLHPAPVRRDRSHRPPPHRGGPRPGRQRQERLLPRDSAAVAAGHPGRLRADRAADVRRLLHRRPRLGLHPDEHDRQPDRRAHAPGIGEGHRRRADAVPLTVPARADVLLPAHYPPGGHHRPDDMSWLRNPWGRPRFLMLITGGYILWSVVPVLLAIAFAFNNGRSRTTWQ